MSPENLENIKQLSGCWDMTIVAHKKTKCALNINTQNSINIQIEGIFVKYRKEYHPAK